MTRRAKLLTGLGHGVSLIRLPLPFERLRSVNAYLVEGAGELALIDCGVHTDEGLDTLAKGMRDLGYSIDDITLLIGTHFHPDHVGLAQEITKISGCAFVMHAAWASGRAEYDSWDISRHRFAELAAVHGASAEDVTAIGAPIERPDWAPQSLAPSATVEDGDTIPLGGGRSLGVIHTPGHDAAHICLGDSLTGALFSGDHVLPRITPVVQYDEAFDQLGTYLSSLESVERLDVGLTYPGHGQVIERGSLRARQISLHHERRLGGIVQELRRGPMTAWTVMNVIFRPNLLVFERRLAFSETLAHLEHLVAGGEAVRFEEDEVWYYRLPARRW